MPVEARVRKGIYNNDAVLDILSFSSKTIKAKKNMKYDAVTYLL